MLHSAHPDSLSLARGTWPDDYILVILQVRVSRQHYLPRSVQRSIFTRILGCLRTQSMVVQQMRRIATFDTRVTASPNPLRCKVRQYRARIFQGGLRPEACRPWRCLRRKGKRSLECATLKMYHDIAWLIPPMSFNV